MHQRDDRDANDEWEDGDISYRSSVVERANELLHRIVGDHEPFANEDDLQESASSMFVAIFETMMGCRLEEVHREPELPWQYSENAQCVIDGLSQKLDRDFDYIDSGLIADGNLDHIGALIEVFLIAAGDGYDDVDNLDGGVSAGEDDDLIDGDDDPGAADAVHLEHLRREHPVEWRHAIKMRRSEGRNREREMRIRGERSHIASKSIVTRAEMRYRRLRVDEELYNGRNRRARMHELKRQERNDERDRKVRDIRAMRMRNDIRRERDAGLKRIKSTEQRLARNLFRKTLKEERKRLLRSRQRTRELKSAAEANEAAKLEAVEKFYDDQIGMLSEHIEIEREKAKKWKQSRKAAARERMRAMHHAKLGALEQMRRELRQLEDLKLSNVEERVEHSQLQRIVRDLVSSPMRSPSRKFSHAAHRVQPPVPSWREREILAAYGIRGGSPSSPSGRGSRTPRHPHSINM
jgi:hypothetical protein